MIGSPEEVEESDDFLQDEGEIDYNKVPEIDLPAPLPSSKFAQNPELLKTLNRGGKRKFDQLIGWSDGGASDRTSKIHQPVFGASISEDLSSDTESRSGMGKSGTSIAGDSSYGISLDEDLRRLPSDMRSLGRDEDLRFNSLGNMSGGPGRPSMGSDQDLRIQSMNFGDKDFRQMPPHSFGMGDSNLDNDPFDERDRDRDRGDRSRWDDENGRGLGDNFNMDFPGNNNFDKHDNMPANMSGMGNNHGMGHMGNMSNHHNMQNINPNMSHHMSSMGPHPSMSSHMGMQNKNNPSMSSHQGMQNMDGPMPHMNSPNMMHHPNMSSMPPGFGPNGMPPGNFSPNFRPPNGNFGGNQHFRPNPMAPFAPNSGPPYNSGSYMPNQGPPNLRGPNSGSQGPPNYDRPGFGGPNFRGPNSSGQGQTGYGGYSGSSKNGPMHNMSNRSRNSNENNGGRSGYGNRGRGRDNDQPRGANARGRDNF